ncbi:hypothetical protein DFH08DRAFT_960432 [Mycena albidolilacea]|uniref:Uncharacterized protein n=1 Tax=Mycena albidolilacea TaxID=1033008 RepID=A0AAD7ERK5_9AGAR|nr:hypothetical protein DFH08DRAFT_960432 [Mycena albidolilacea]
MAASLWRRGGWEHQRSVLYSLVMHFALRGVPLPRVSTSHLLHTIFHSAILIFPYLPRCMAVDEYIPFSTPRRLDATRLQAPARYIADLRRFPTVVTSLPPCSTYLFPLLTSFRMHCLQHLAGVPSTLPDQQPAYGLCPRLGMHDPLAPRLHHLTPSTSHPQRRQGPLPHLADTDSARAVGPASATQRITDLGTALQRSPKVLNLDDAVSDIQNPGFTRLRSQFASFPAVEDKAKGGGGKYFPSGSKAKRKILFFAQSLTVELPASILSTPIDPPMITVVIHANSSLLGGTEGTKHMLMSHMHGAPPSPPTPLPSPSPPPQSISHALHSLPLPSHPLPPV